MRGCGSPLRSRASPVKVAQSPSRCLYRIAIEVGDVLTERKTTKRGCSQHPDSIVSAHSRRPVGFANPWHCAHGVGRLPTAARQHMPGLSQSSEQPMHTRFVAHFPSRRSACPILHELPGQHSRLPPARRTRDPRRACTSQASIRRQLRSIARETHCLRRTRQGDNQAVDQRCPSQAFLIHRFSCRHLSSRAARLARARVLHQEDVPTRRTSDLLSGGVSSRVQLPTAVWALDGDRAATKCDKRLVVNNLHHQMAFFQC